MKFCCLLLMGLCLGLAACGGNSTPPLPTNAPVIPPTRTASPTITNTPAPTLNPLTPTGDVNQPTWTATATFTPSATATPPPSWTPRPITPSPTPLESGQRDLGGGQVELVLGAEDLNAQWETAENQPRLGIDPDGLSLRLTVPNTLLGSETRLTIQLTTRLEGGKIILSLGDYISQGPAVTSDQVRAWIAEVEGLLNESLGALLGGAFQVQNITLAPDFMILLIELDN